MRFLKAREWNVTKAHKMVRHVQWKSHVIAMWQWLFSNIGLLLEIGCYYPTNLVVNACIQIIDCLNWRVQNEIDNILSVSLDSTNPCILLFGHFLVVHIFLVWSLSVIQRCSRRGPLCIF